MKKLKKEMMGKLANGDDPMEPWSKKHNAPLEERSEQQLLVAYIRSLGYAPEFMTSSQKSAYARSKGFAQYKVSHDFTAKNEAYVRKTAAQKIAAALQKQREKNKPYEAHQERMRQLDALMKGMKTEEEINEAGTGLLMTFIRAKGLDPLTMHGNQKASYSRSSEFRIFKRKHRDINPVKETSGMGERGDDWNEETVKEEVDKKDTVVLDIPLLIRVLELAREDIKTDMDLHRVVERLIDIRKKGTLTMDDYDFVAGLKEEFQIDEMKKQPDNMDADTIGVAREDLRQWFSKTHPKGDWKRINSKGEVAGPCAREPGEPKPKCMSKEKRAELSKSERAAAVVAKRKYDSVADRSGKGGKPVNVSNYGKGKLSEENIDEACWDTHKQIGMKKKGEKIVPNCVPKNEESEQIDEKNQPTNPTLWSRAKSLARSKFDVYPSAYANGWASKWYKSKGGGWKSVNEDKYQDPHAATQTVGMEVEGKSRAFKAVKKLTRVNETTYDWEKTEKDDNSGKKQMTAKIIMKGGKTMTGQPRDTIQIDPIVKTKLDANKSVNPNNNK